MFASVIVLSPESPSVPDKFWTYAVKAAIEACVKIIEMAWDWKFWLFVAIAGGFAHLVLFAVDREIDAGVERLAELPTVRRTVLDTDPNLKLVSEHSPYMRNER
jgi:hypothetical protein